MSTIENLKLKERQGNIHHNYNNPYPATSWRQLFQQQHSHNNVTVYTVVIKHLIFCFYTSNFKSFDRSRKEPVTFGGSGGIHTKRKNSVNLRRSKVSEMAHNLRSKDKGTKDGEEEETLDPVRATQIRIMLEAAEDERRIRREAAKREEQRAEREEQRADEDRRLRREADIQLKINNRNSQQEDRVNMGNRFGPMLGRCPTDPREISAYFQRIEGIFESYRISDEAKAELLLSRLEPKMKTILNELRTEDYTNYEAIKQQIIRSCRFCPKKLRDAFFSTYKAKEETYPAFVAQLYRHLKFYFQSRKIETLEQAMSLWVVDRLKEVIPKNLVEYILAQEGDEWLPHDKVANLLETYEANMNMRGSTNSVSSFRTQSGHAHLGSDRKGFVKDERRGPSMKPNCFTCSSTGHLAKHCTKKSNYTTPAKKVMNCQITPRMHSKQFGLTEAMRVEKYFERPYVKVKIQPGPVCEALVDSGAEVCGISQELCQELNLPSLGTERIKGWSGQVAEVDATWVTLTQGDKAATPGVRVWCAVVPNASEPLIINPGVVEQLKLVTPYVVPAAEVLSASGSLVNLGTFYNVDAPHGQCQERYDKIQNRDVDDEKDDEVCEVNNRIIDGSIITNKIQNRDVDDEKDDEVCEFNNCKIDGSVVVDGVPNRDVDEEKDDEGSEKSCKVMIKDAGRADISQEKKDSAVNKINKYKFELGEVGSSGIGLVDRSNVVGLDVNYVVRVAEMTIDGVDETNKVLTKSRKDVRESPRNLDGICNSEKQKVVEHLDDVDEEETDGQFNRGKKKKADEHKLDLDEAEEHVDDVGGGCVTEKKKFCQEQHQCQTLTSVRVTSTTTTTTLIQQRRGVSYSNNNTRTTT
ncbi:hypothetical protein HELRODRAFT_164074 [Helobdella robusta]|uniref:CCHC-type domain-containing protein n=1 Tax=Helobdella robusta TaxID=6412 RepID=T1EUV9_HELRO|nr:hypothetical protein HELRODRAFT_164074 [Helobdella robusta]ESN94267.1 hypothetical protein HELRODRAFT_164074 [Helobdella robusta]